MELPTVDGGIKLRPLGEKQEETARSQAVPGDDPGKQEGTVRGISRMMTRRSPQCRRLWQVPHQPRPAPPPGWEESSPPAGHDVRFVK